MTSAEWAIFVVIVVVAASTVALSVAYSLGAFHA